VLQCFGQILFAPDFDPLKDIVTRKTGRLTYFKHQYTQILENLPGNLLNLFSRPLRVSKGQVPPDNTPVPDVHAVDKHSRNPADPGNMTVGNTCDQRSEFSPQYF